MSSNETPSSAIMASMGSFTIKKQENNINTFNVQSSNLPSFKKENKDEIKMKVQFPKKEPMNFNPIPIKMKHSMEKPITTSTKFDTKKILSSLKPPNTNEDRSMDESQSQSQNKNANVNRNVNVNRTRNRHNTPNGGGSVSAITITTRSGQRKFQCDKCNKQYKHLCNLKSHQKVHTSEALVCNHCQKKFGRKANFKEHLRIHTGETPYQCNFCKRKFKHHHRLDFYIRTK